MIKDIIHTSMNYLTKLGFNSQPQKLLELVRQGKVSEAVEMIQSGADVKAVDSNGTSALMTSSTDNYIDIFEAILNSSTIDLKHLNMKDNLGDSAIHYAATFRNLPLLKLLVAKGVDINYKNNKGKTPLFIICENYNNTIALQQETLDFAKELIALKADVNTQDNELNTPLIRSAINDDTQLVDYLLSQGANPRVKNSMGYSAFRHCLENANKDIAISLILSINNYQEIENKYAKTIKNSTAYPEIKPTLDTLKIKDNLESILTSKSDKIEKKMKI